MLSLSKDLGQQELQITSFGALPPLSGTLFALPLFFLEIAIKVPISPSCRHRTLSHTYPFPVAGHSLSVGSLKLHQLT